MAEYIIPLTPVPQSFGIALAGKEYRLLVRWFDAPGAGWVLDILQPDNATPVILGIPLVTGCDLLGQYGYMEFGGELWLSGEYPPTPENLGSESLLLFVVEDAA